MKTLLITVATLLSLNVVAQTKGQIITLNNTNIGVVDSVKTKSIKNQTGDYNTNMVVYCSIDNQKNESYVKELLKINTNVKYTFVFNHNTPFKVVKHSTINIFGLAFRSKCKSNYKYKSIEVMLSDMNNNNYQLIEVVNYPPVGLLIYSSKNVYIFKKK